jgi:two-component system CheB/CheR fusion protein
VLRDARQTKHKVSYDSLPVQLEDAPEYISIVAQPIFDHNGQQTSFMAISFLRGKRELSGDVRKFQIDTAAAQRISNLEQELKITKDNLRQTVTELESVNAELQAANEELQSVNEELYTVNSEYQSKVTELAGLNDDMANFLSTTLVGILMVDQNLNIRKFTEYISDEFNVADQDVGRSLRYIAYNFGTIDLIKQCRQVLKTMNAIEQHCTSIAGKTYLIRIAPYLTRETIAKDNTDAVKETGKKKLQGLVITFVDTTKQVDDQEQIDEMAKALRQAVKSSQEKETFLSHMSHDMRTPMTAILGLTELSLREKNLPAEVKDNLEKIQTSSQYLVGLMEEILETSKINAGKVVSVSTAVKEETVFNSVATIISEQARDNHQIFDLDVEGCQNRYVLMDQQHVERILMNLLSNSLKFTPENGRISLIINVDYHDGKAFHTYIVKDNGIGISESFQARMFLPFEQDSVDGEHHDGTGLGLYICKNLVELLGGTIDCTSEVGNGTTFIVKLSYSIATDEQIELQTHRTETYEDQVLYGKNVLLAEDNHINAEVIIKILNTKGIHSELARDGQEVVDLYKSRGPYHYQAILMDLMMPVKDGEEAAKEIRSSGLEDSESIPIIALTADVTDDVETRCRDAGMNYCISKPIDAEDLFYHFAEAFEHKK